MLLFARRGDLGVSTRKMTEEAAQVGTGPAWEGYKEKKKVKNVRSQARTFP